MFTPLNKAVDEIGGSKLVAVGGLKPPTGDTYLTGFTNSLTDFSINPTFVIPENFGADAEKFIRNPEVSNKNEYL
ncbi:MAG: hypothetical protein U9R14_02975 [Patescibacteria group bacterium]|nr:hypothetical protein [Patescibacteria group bacterium]